MSGSNISGKYLTPEPRPPPAALDELTEVFEDVRSDARDTGLTYNARVQQSDGHGVRRLFEGFSLRVDEPDNAQVCRAYLRAEGSAVMCNPQCPLCGL